MTYKFQVYNFKHGLNNRVLTPPAQDHADETSEVESQDHGSALLSDNCTA